MDTNEDVNAGVVEMVRSEPYRYKYCDATDTAVVDVDVAKRRRDVALVVVLLTMDVSIVPGGHMSPGAHGIAPADDCPSRLHIDPVGHSNGVRIPGDGQ